MVYALVKNETANMTWLSEIIPSIDTAQKLYTYRVANIVNMFLPLALITIGVCVNFLIILVMRSPHFRRVSTSTFMTVSASNDLCSLLLSLFPHWLYLNYPTVYQRGPAADKLCTFFNFYGFSNTDMTLILTASMTMDRAYIIKFPLRAADVIVHNKQSGRRPLVVCVMGMMAVMVKNFHLLFSSQMAPPDTPERLCIVCPAGVFVFYVKEVWPWIHDVYLFLCFVTIIVGNVVIIVNVRRSVVLNCSRRWQQAQCERDDTMRRESGGSNSVSTSGRFRQITTMILAKSFTTVLLSCPFGVYTGIVNKDPEMHTDPSKMAANQLLFSVFFYMLYSNKCVNFFLYAVSGAKFRVALLMLLLPRQRNGPSARPGQARAAGRGPGGATVGGGEGEGRESAGEGGTNGCHGDDVNPGHAAALSSSGSSCFSRRETVAIISLGDFDLSERGGEGRGERETER